jgi:hypothetical protein
MTSSVIGRISMTQKMTQILANMRHWTPVHEATARGVITPSVVAYQRTAAARMPGAGQHLAVSRRAV